jgi:prolyl-tRNA editing enzyme YbaK/EbsC (Cys-tRNA(Pro) deacylase)
VRGTIEVNRFLTERGIRHEFYRLERPLRKIDEAAVLLGLEARMVVRAELFAAGERFVLALAPTSTLPASDAIASATSTPRVRPLSAARTAAHSGFLPDWLPPVAHERPSTALIDETLVDAAVLYAPGGDPGVMLMITAGDLVRATAADVAALSTPLGEPEEFPSARTTTLR